MEELRSKMTYANVMASLAVFLVLGGGTAFAAREALLPTNSVGTRQLKPGAVTPRKLSVAAKESLRGAAGEAGAVGPKGDRGAPGSTGAQGLAGTTGDEPFVIDARAEGVAVPQSYGEFEPPLSGTTSWTPEPGQAGILTGKVTAELVRRRSEYGCSSTIFEFLDGALVDVVGLNAQEPPRETSVSFALSPIALDEPGSHTVTVKFSGSPECAARSEITSVHLVASPLG